MIQLSTRDVEKIIAHVFDMPDHDMLAMRARLENLRKKGCPHGLVTGRGKVAKFDFEQLTDVSVALSLIDAGLSPDCAVSAVEDTDGVIKECFGLLALQKPSSDELRAALDDGQWWIGRTITAWCCVHRLFTSPDDRTVRVATWSASDSSGGQHSVNVGLSAVHIDCGALFVRIVKAIAHITDVDAIELARRHLAKSEEYVVHP